MILNLTSELETFTGHSDPDVSTAYNSASSPGDQGPKTPNWELRKISQNDNEDMIGKAELLVSLYKQEKLHAHIGEAYKLAALVCREVGHEWEMKKWAMLGAEALLVSEGVGDGGWKEMRRLSRGLKL